MTWVGWWDDCRSAGLCSCCMFLLWIFLALNVTAAAEHKRFRKIWEFLEQNFIFLKKLQSEHDMWGRGQCIDLFYWELQPRAPTEECCIRKFLLRVRDVVPLSRHSHLPVISNSKTLQTKYLTKIFPVNREFSEPSLHQMYLHISGGRVGGSLSSCFLIPKEENINILPAGCERQSVVQVTSVKVNMWMECH